jgi:UDP-N-acetylmuramyl tripeptide synthase
LINLQLDEVRRLTGPNLLWDKPGAIVDVLIDGIEKKAVLVAWQKWINLLLKEFSWAAEATTYREHEYGFNFAISAPMDALYTACDVAELAWHCCAAELQQRPQLDWQCRLEELRIERQQEQNPQLIKLMAAAQVHQVTCLMDDDQLSLGMGKNMDSWPVRQLPIIAQLDWQKYHDIPIALITGTNGKSTSVRLAAQIAKAAGICAGVTSTDFIRVGDDIIDHGDYSGPGGARMLLWDKRTELAFLEVARGGILRRGLPIKKVNAALITNVASDHLGQYGINTVAQLAETKFVVAKALEKDSVLVLNADNSLVVEQAKKITNTLCWFSTDENNPLIKKHIQKGERAVFIREDYVIYHFDGHFETVAKVADAPMTLNGAALYNVQNALGVVGLCKALNLPQQAILNGLMAFGSDAEDNPGRGNHYQVNGCTVIVDFAHNEHGMRAVVAMARNIPAKKYITMFSHAGDRSDQDIKDMTHVVTELNADLYIPVEVEKYIRGRKPNELPVLIEQFLLQKQVPQQHIQISASPLLGTKKALLAAEPGDVVLLFVLDERQAIHDWLTSLIP